MGYFIGDPPQIGKVHATMNRLWSVMGKPSKIDAQYINPKTVLFKIDNAQIRSRVLRRHYWHISDVPMVVQDRNPRSSTHTPDLIALPIWDISITFLISSSLKWSHVLGRSGQKIEKLHPNT